jgi:hypothetical protein
MFGFQSVKFLQKYKPLGRADFSGRNCTMIAGMTIEEHVNYVNRNAEAFLEQYGMTHLYVGSIKKDAVQLSEPAFAEKQVSVDHL